MAIISSLRLSGKQYDKKAEQLFNLCKSLLPSWLVPNIFRSAKSQGMSSELLCLLVSLSGLGALKMLPIVLALGNGEFFTKENATLVYTEVKHLFPFTGHISFRIWPLNLLLKLCWFEELLPNLLKSPKPSPGEGPRQTPEGPG